VYIMISAKMRKYL